MPSAGVVAVSPDTGRETMPIPPDGERVPGPGVTAAATDAGWETMSIPPDHAHIPGAGDAAGTPGSDREMIPISSDCERVPGTGGVASNPFFERFYVYDGILVEVRFFQDGPRLRRAIESLVQDHFQLLDPRGPRPPPVGST